MELNRHLASRPPGRGSPESPQPDRRLQCSIQGGDLAPGAARRILERFEPDLDARGMDEARLLISELVGNSVRHAGAGVAELVELTLACSRTVALRVTVGDHGHGFDAATAMQPKDASSEGGRGLFFVDTIADRWGMTNDGMTRVWFELSR